MVSCGGCNGMGVGGVRGGARGIPVVVSSPGGARIARRLLPDVRQAPRVAPRSAPCCARTRSSGSALEAMGLGSGSAEKAMGLSSGSAGGRHVPGDRNIGGGILSGAEPCRACAAPRKALEGSGSSKAGEGRDRRSRIALMHRKLSPPKEA